MNLPSDLIKKIENVAVLKAVQRVSESMGIPSFIVGGYVRDLLLNREGQDIDIVCLGDSIGLAKQISIQYSEAHSLSFYKNFGTAKIGFGKYTVEFVTARKESYQEHSRKPKVLPSTLEDDQKRRDFTINAISISLRKEDWGHLIDPFDGLLHLKYKLIKTPLDPKFTFSDDPLRMMRAVRFALQLGFDIDHETFEAIKQNAQRLKIISMERISSELQKMILADKPSIGFKLLYHARLLQEFFPEFVALMGQETINGISHKDNFYHTLKVLDNVAAVSSDLWLRWAAILHDIAKPKTKRFDPKLGWTFHGHDAKGAYMVPKIFKKLKLPLNQKMKQVQKLVQLHLRPISLVREGTSDSAIRRLLFEAGQDFDHLMVLCKADITSKNDQKVKQYIKNFETLEKRSRELEERDKIRNFQPAFTGNMIMQEFALSPGKQIGKIKSALREAILDGTIHNDIEASRQFIIRKFRELVQEH